MVPKALLAVAVEDSGTAPAGTEVMPDVAVHPEVQLNVTPEPAYPLVRTPAVVT